MQIIKKFNINSYTYKLGYDEWGNKVYPRIEIYKAEELLAEGYLSYWIDNGSFYFDADISSYNVNGNVKTMKEMFTKLRKYNEIPEYIEKEYESLFIMYKLNNFKRLDI